MLEEKEEFQSKLYILLKKRKISQKKLVSMINKKFPDLPISTDLICRITSGTRVDYRLSTILRISKTLNVSPNAIIDYK